MIDLLPADVHRLIIEHIRIPLGESTQLGDTPRNLLISGLSGSGKTTLLNYLANQVPAELRLVTVTSADEFYITADHDVLTLNDRTHMGKAEMLTNAIRMRAQWIAVDELRDEEAGMQLWMGLAGIATMGTINANDPAEALTRLANLALLGENRDHISGIAEATKMVHQSKHLLIHVARDGRRRKPFIQTVATLNPVNENTTAVTGGNVTPPAGKPHLKILYQRA